ncbi:MAG: nickel pincer cofactor biosynthesis protein LarB [Planctomycetales bacterium]|nr:nickel pincer cofactor biosynthesis protein LarB [Planctomycetales bacterium]
MNAEQIKGLATGLLDGRLSVDAFVRQITRPATVALPDAHVDLQRAARCGFPEVIYGEGKPPETLEKIVASLLAEGQPVLVTRLSPMQAERLVQRHPQARYNAVGRTLRVAPDSGGVGQRWVQAGQVAVVAAGTSDLVVAEEAVETAAWTGAEVTKIFDVGVAGPQRLLPYLPTIRAADAVVVVAGMEGALPSVVGGHVASPVIAVPTSVGYGANFGGLAALLGMLNSCAANVTVVNIDAGFKGGYLAGLIAQRAANHPRPDGSTEDDSDEGVLPR